MNRKILAALVSILALAACGGPSEPAPTTETMILVNPCTDPAAPLFCQSVGTSACCPASNPYYCPSVGGCFPQLPTAAACGVDGVVSCKENAPW